jgi:hypothetical protein
MPDFTSVEARIAPGTTHCLIPLLCIQRIHLLPIAASPSVFSCALGRVLDGLSSVGEFSCCRSALKLVWCWRPPYGCDDDEDRPYADAGEAAREDTGERGGVRSQCWLAELSMRCRRGVGAIISGSGGGGLAEENVRVSRYYRVGVHGIYFEL